MKDSEIRISENIVPKILALASRNYADRIQSYSVSDLVQAGVEAQIPPELVQQAIKKIQARQKRAKQQRQRFLKIGTGILAAIALWGIWTYNSLSRADSNVDAAWAQVENQLQRQANLIPTLVSITQVYIQQEQELIAVLMESHQAYLQASTQEKKLRAIAAIDQAIDRFWTDAATNPQLQSSQLLTNLQYELTGTENRIAVERMRYSQAVKIYNQKVRQFPNSLLAKAFGFEGIPFFLVNQY